MGRSYAVVPLDQRACRARLIIVGIILLNEDALRLSANSKILLKQIHVVLGYVMGLN